MSKITRSDVYARDEKGGEWFEEFLQSLAEQKESSVLDVLNNIQHKKSETAQGVVDKYREMIGLDAAAEIEDNNNIVSIASSIHPLSIRHAEMLDSNVVSVIEKDPGIKEDVRSLCEHSGGTKNTHAIISFLRDKLGKELVRYSDKDLIEYIESAKKEYEEDLDMPNIDVGRVGTDTEDHPEDNDADYITHGKGS